MASNNNIKNILIIGKVGSGKSTLANVLVNKNEKFEEVFEEFESSSSKIGTRDIKSEEFEWDEKKYCVIDTPGISNVNEDIINSMKERIRPEERISQILLVVSSGDFTGEERRIFKSLGTGNDVASYVTIVRTHFPSFTDGKKNEEDSESLIERVGLFASCKVIHIDNPSINTSGEGTGKNNEFNKEIRKNSREKLLKHLQKNCQGFYKLDDMLEKILEQSSNNNSERKEPEIEVAIEVPVEGSKPPAREGRKICTFL